jgi:hypothetical protein
MEVVRTTCGGEWLNSVTPDSIDGMNMMGAAISKPSIL